jgi:hypothetical protein
MNFEHTEERRTHYELARVQARTERSGDSWVLNGAKSVVLQGEAADLFIVSARISGDIDGEAGISPFVVPKQSAGLDVLGSPTIDGGRVADLLLEIEQARSAVINAAAALDAERITRERAVGRQGQHRPHRHAGGRGMHPDAWRHRHDLGTAAGPLCQAPGDDRPPAGRRGPPSRALHRAMSTTVQARCAACDMLVAARGAFFTVAYVKVGLTPAAAPPHSWRSPCRAS